MGLLHLPGLVFIFVDAGFVLQMRETTLQPRKSLPLGGDEDEREDSEETDDGEQHVNPHDLVLYLAPGARPSQTAKAANSMM